MNIIATGADGFIGFLFDRCLVREIHAMGTIYFIIP